MSSGAQSGREIEVLLSEPTQGAIQAVRSLDGDFMVIGVGGKMGSTLALMLRRALDAAGKKTTRILGVSRFSRPETRILLEEFGIEPVSCDLADYEAVMRLPNVANVEYLAGQKFGTSSAPEETWIQNAVVPSHVARRFRESRIVVFSTGCVYPFVPVEGKGSNETSPLAFKGEYASTCVGRERVFSHYSRRHGTRQLFFRLSYAVELRYGVLVDIGQRILSGLPVDVTMNIVNVIWQGDACARAIQCLLHVESPPAILNVTGSDKISIQDLATRLGRALGRPAIFEGTPAKTAWHVDSSRSVELFGPPTMKLDAMIKKVAEHLLSGGPLLGKPTHFECRDGTF